MDGVAFKVGRFIGYGLAVGFVVAAIGWTFAVGAVLFKLGVWVLNL